MQKIRQWLQFMLSKVRHFLRSIQGWPRSFWWWPLVTTALAGYLAGLCSAVLYGDVVFDSGLATLLGSALGAGVTVSGSLWIARYQLEARERSFRRLVADSAAAILDQTIVLDTLLRLEDWGENAAYASKIGRQVGYLKEAIELFERNAPFSEIGDYEARLWISRLQEKISSSQRVLEKELRWLEHPTTPVLQNARTDLGAAAEPIFEACLTVTEKLRSTRDLLSDREIQRRVELLGD